MKQYRTRLKMIEGKITNSKLVEVVCLFSREDDEQVYEDAACTIPVADDSDVWEESKYRVCIRFHTLDGSKK